MKKPLLIMLLCLFACIAKAQTDTGLDSELNVKANRLDNSNQVFTALQVMPEFPGGITKFNEYVADSSKYKGRGTVLVKFIVERNGSLSDFKILRSTNDNANAESVRLLKDGPKWQAGRQNDTPVRVVYVIPVKFKED